ncbi:MAG: helix-turn-helix domain-containing protein [Oscillospiraceae bacterium]|jgi:hypothetical protein|nr:helix-turn-helix domain-containing protein [Oscillospiraceae bacterium]
MSTITIRKSQDNSINQNIYLTDPRLSLKAKGLMAQLTTYPQKNNFTTETLTFINQGGKDSIRSAIQELEQTSYLERHQNRNKTGQLLPTEYKIYENPYEAMATHQKNCAAIFNYGIR